MEKRRLTITVTDEGIVLECGEVIVDATGNDLQDARAALQDVGWFMSSGIGWPILDYDDRV